MKTIIKILLITIFLASCKQSIHKPNYYSVQEDSVIYQIIDSVIMHDSVWRKFLLVPPPLFSEDLSKIELEQRKDSLLQKFDTTELFVAFDDSLIIFSRFYESDRFKKNKNYLKYNCEDLDTSYNILFDRLVNDPILTNRNIEISKIHTNFRYTIVPADSVDNILKEGLKLLEVHTFSRIIFNESFNKACLYEQSICGRLCGGGYILFLEKNKRLWQIKMRHCIWIS